MQNNESLPILTHERNFLRFWKEAVENPRATASAGRTMFDEVLFVKITSPGDKSEMVYKLETTYSDGRTGKSSEPVWKRFEKYITDYKAKGAATAVSGTPIEMWPLADTRRVAMLKHNGIYSVEALASLSDSGIATIGMGGRELVQKAKDWLATAANSAAAMQAQERERATEARFAALEEQFNALAQAMNELPADAQAQVKASLGRRGRKNAA